MSDDRASAGRMNRPVKLSGVPDTDEGMAELRERIRAEHAAYMRKWAGWRPSQG